MTTPHVMLTALFGLLGSMKLVKAPYLVAAASELGFTARQYQLIGFNELLAVAGLLVGFWWTPAAVAAGVGLVLQMLGALLLHVRKGDGARQVLPAGLVLALAAGLVVAHL